VTKVKRIAKNQKYRVLVLVHLFPNLYRTTKFIRMSTGHKLALLVQLVIYKMNLVRVQNIELSSDCFCAEYDYGFTLGHA